MVSLSGSYTSPDCKAECENFNEDCWTYGCDYGCGGVRVTDTECVLTIGTDDFSYTEDETAHYKKYVCDIPDGTTGSIQVITSSDGESGEDTDEETVVESSTETVVEESSETENLIIDDDGTVSCT